MHTYITENSKQTKQKGSQFAKEIAKQLLRRKGRAGAFVICLYGELGSGKTTFAQGMGAGFGISHRILSPTFTIVRRYKPSGIEGFFYHLDLYRLESKKDVDGIGIQELFEDQASCVVIEWAEKIADLLPSFRTDIHFFVTPDGTHTIEVKT